MNSDMTYHGAIELLKRMGWNVNETDMRATMPQSVSYEDITELEWDAVDILEDSGWYCDE